MRAQAILAMILFAASVASVAAQTPQPAETSAAPVPAQFINAKRAFIANGAGDNNPDVTKSTNGPNGIYNQFYADVKTLGRYELVSSLSEADIVFEITVDYTVFNRTVPYPQFRIEVRDPKTNVLLWTFTEPMTGNVFSKSGSKYVAQSISRLTDDLKKLVGSP